MKHFALLCRFCRRGFRSTKRWKRHENRERLKTKLASIPAVLLEMPMLPAMRVRP